jgi:hypothetical protein
MNEIIFVVEDVPERGYTTRAVGESIFTEVESLDDSTTVSATRCAVISMRVMLRSSSVCTSCETKSSLHKVTRESVWH